VSTRLHRHDERAELARDFPDHGYGSRRSAAQVLPKLATGVDRLLRTDRARHGSDPVQWVTRVNAAAGAYRLSGSKMWISNSPIADVFVVWAKDDEGTVRGFVSKKACRGCRAGDRGKFSLRASITGEM